MADGITITSNSDASYMGHRSTSSDLTETTFSWSDNYSDGGNFGPDYISFRFTAGDGLQNNNLGDLNGRDPDGREILRLQSNGNVGIGPKFGVTQSDIPQSDLHIHAENNPSNSQGNGELSLTKASFQMTLEGITGQGDKDGFIALLFLFIGLLEDTGSMARAAFLIDRLMARVGLHGKAFVPLLSGYACAIPAILGTRTISSFKDRLVTIMMIRFMSCSARLPVYVLLISALFDGDARVGPFTQASLVLLAMYVLSTVSALAVGAIYKRTLLRGPTPPLVLELPPDRLPRVRNRLLTVYDRTVDFVRDAGTVILAMTVVLWALLSFPRLPEAPPEAQVDPIEVVGSEPTAIEHSLGGRFGKLIEPALTPMGQDFRMGIAIVGSFAAREVFVSTLGLVHGIEADDDDTLPLREALRAAKQADGQPR